MIQGKYEVWYRNGQKYIDGEFEKGKLNGKFVIYWRGGNGKYEGYWKNGQPWDGTVQVGHELRRYNQGKFLGLVKD